MSKLSITDPRIQIRPSSELESFIKTELVSESEVPENLLKFFKKNTKKNIFEEEIPADRFTKIEKQIICDLNNGLKDFEFLKDEKILEEDEDEKFSGPTLNLNDLKWINLVLKKRRDSDDTFNIYLHELLTDSKLILPENETQERNPELEARCVKLREKQAHYEYNKMTKSVDNSRRRLPEDTISYQMKQLNSQLIAVAQFIFSVAAGFLFGFIGVALIVGDLDFGFRLLLGIICALIIALAEIYFLAKKLNEDDTIVDSTKATGNPDEKKFKLS